MSDDLPKPWDEETWSTPDAIWGPSKYRGVATVWTLTSAEPHPIFEHVDNVSYVTQEKREQRASLASAAPDLYRALAAVEWSDGVRAARTRCPSCCSEEPPVHEPDCTLNAALKKARGE